MLKDKVLETIKKYNLIQENDKIVLGVSGGPDSISMLVILNELSKKMDFSIVVAHINHGIRENAKIDEEYVKSFCEKLDIPFFVYHTNINELSKELGRGLEETGRIERYKFFDEVQEKTSSNKIAIAHNANDNVETVFMNIVRGSGLSGLKGILPINGKYIRPLIECERKEIESFCEIENLNPRHDESNDENVYTRNKMRNIAIPYIIEELNPNIIDSVTRLSLIARDELDYLDSETQNAYNDLLIEEKLNQDGDELGTIVLNLKKFNQRHSAIQKRVILYSINRIFGTTKGIERIHVEDIIKLCNNNIGNKYLTPNKKTKIVMKNKNINIIGLK